MTAPELTFFVHLTATPAWLALARPERQKVITDQVTPLLGRHPEVAIRWYDAEAWSARPSDILVATTTDPRAWSDLFELLRDTDLWAVPYFEVELIVPAMEDGFAEYEARHGSRD